jgi:threonine aldolase
LEETPKRLCEDHENARLLADRLANLPGISLDPGKVRTNIVIFDIGQSRIAPDEFVARAKACGVLLSCVGGTRIRVVTHYDVSPADCQRAADVIAGVLRAS